MRRRTREVSNRGAGSVSLYLAVNNDKSMERMIADTLDETCGDRAADPQSKKMGILLGILIALVLAALSWLTMIGVAIAACFTFFPNQSNAAMGMCSTLARNFLPSDIWDSSALAQVSTLLANIAQSSSSYLIGLILARVGIAVVRFLLSIMPYPPLIVGPTRRYYGFRRERW